MIKKDIESKIIDDSKKTVGYAECENKHSFITGVTVAIAIAESFYSGEIKNLESQLSGLKNSCKNVTDDLRTIANILYKYAEK